MSLHKHHHEDVIVQLPSSRGPSLRGEASCTQVFHRVLLPSMFVL